MILEGAGKDLGRTCRAAIDENAVKDNTPFDEFLTNNIHEVLKVCAELRPSVDISVVPLRGS